MTIAVVAPMLAAAAAVGLGLWGWLDNGLRAPDALYRALMTLGVADEYRDLELVGRDWRVEVGRWLGAFAFFSAALGALGALFRDSLARAAARLGRQAAVVIGDHPIAAAAFALAGDEGTSRLRIGAASARLGWWSLALPWLDPGRKVETVIRHARHARRVLIADGDDALTLGLVHAARTAAPRARITALVDSAHVARDASGRFSDSRLRILTYGGLAARALHRDHPPFLIARNAGQACVSVLVVGFGDTGQAIAHDLVVNCRTSDLGLPSIAIVDPDAAGLLAAWRQHAPELDLACHVEALDGSLGRSAASPPPLLAGHGDLTCVYVCLPGDSASLAAIGALQDWLRASRVAVPPVFVHLSDPEVLPASGRGAGPAHVTAFGQLDALVRECAFLTDDPDAVACAYHEGYRATLTPAQRADPANTTALPWEKLPETYRAASRAAVAHIPAKLASAGIDPALWRGKTGLPRLPAGTSLIADEDMADALAELEHERWNAERRLEGWRFGDIARKDEALLVHPDLRPFDELSAQVQGFDVALVRLIDQILHEPAASAAGRPGLASRP